MIVLNILIFYSLLMNVSPQEVVPSCPEIIAKISIRQNEQIQQIIAVPGTNFLLIATQNSNSGSTTFIYYNYVSNQYANHYTVQTTFIFIDYSTDLDQWIALSNSYLIVMNLYQFQIVSSYIYTSYINFFLIPGTFTVLLTMSTFQSQQVNLLDGNAMNQFYTVNWWDLSNQNNTMSFVQTIKEGVNLFLLVQTSQVEVWDYDQASYLYTLNKISNSQTPLSPGVAGFTIIPNSNYGFQAGGQNNTLRCWYLGQVSKQNIFRQVSEIKVGFNQLAQIGYLNWNNLDYIYLTELDPQDIQPSNIYVYLITINEQANQCSMNLIIQHTQHFQNIMLIQNTKKFMLYTKKNLFTIDDIFDLSSYKILTNKLWVESAQIDTLNEVSQLVSASSDHKKLIFLDYSFNIKEQVLFQKGISLHQGIIHVTNLPNWIVANSYSNPNIIDNQENGFYFYNYITGETQYLMVNLDSYYTTYIDTAFYLNNKINICVRVLYKKTFFTISQEQADNLKNKYKFYSFQCFVYSLTDQSSKVKNLDLSGVYPNGYYIEPVNSIVNFQNNEYWTLFSDGNMYIWDLNTFQYKKNVFLNCINSSVMELFEAYDQLIIDCYNTQTIRAIYISLNFTQYILEKHNTWMQSCTSDKINGWAFFQGVDDSQIRVFDVKGTPGSNILFRFNLKYSSFIEYIFFIPNSNKLVILSQEINVVINMSTCLVRNMQNSTDSNICQICKNNFIFDLIDYSQLETKPQYVTQGFYGFGTNDQPFTSSRQIIEQQIKASFLIKSIDSMSYLQSFIKVNSKNVNFLINNSEFLNNDSINEEKYFYPLFESDSLTLTYQNNQLASFQNFKGIIFSDTIFQYDFSSVQQANQNSYQCGLIVQSVQNLNLINYKFSFIGNINNASPQCGQITIINSNLYLQNTSYKDINIIEPLIISQNSPKIQLSYLNIELCNIQSQSILSLLQGSTNLIIDNLIFQNNTGKYQDQSQSGQLFQFTTIAANNLYIAFNILQNMYFFNSIISQQSQVDLQLQSSTFIFKQIQFIENNIVSAQQTIFAQMKFPSFQNPNFVLICDDIIFSNNTIIAINQQDQANKEYQVSKISQNSLFSSYNLASFKFNNLTLKDTINIGVVNAFQGESFYANNILIYNSQTPIIQSIRPPPLFYFFQIQNFTLQNSIFKDLYTMDQSIINIQNSQNRQNSIQIYNSTFKGNYIHSTQPFYPASTIQIQSNSETQIILDQVSIINCFLNSTPNNYFPSSNSFWIQNIQGQVYLTNSEFTNNYSNGPYNIMQIVSNSMNIHNCTFQNSSYPDSVLQQFNQTVENSINSQGAFINVQSQFISISQSKLEKSYSKQNPLMYLTAFSGNLIIKIDECQFFDSYSIQGSAIEVYSSSNQINFTLTNSKFLNIFLRGDNPQLIKLGLNKKKQVKDLIYFQNNTIKNIFGDQGCSFFSQYSGDIILDQIYISSDTSLFSINPFFQSLYQNQLFCSQIDSMNNKIMVSNYSISNIQQVFKIIYSMQNTQSFQNQLFISDFNSDIKIAQLIINECTLLPQQRLMKFSSSVFFGKSLSISQINNLDSLDKTLTSDSYFNQGNMYFENSEILFINLTTNNLKCFYCNGGSLQFKNSTGEIVGSQFEKNIAKNGGVISLETPNKSFKILSCQFQENKAINLGGDFYMYNTKDVEYEVRIMNSTFKYSSSSQYGGSGYLEQSFSSSLKNVVFLQQISFIQTQSQIGGAIFYENIIPIKSQVNFINTSASKYGNKDYSFPRKAQLINPTKSIIPANETYAKILSFKSGDFLPQLSFHFLDQYNEILKISDKDFIQVKKTYMYIDSQTPNITSYQLFGVQNGQYDFNTFMMHITQNRFVGIPGNTVILYILFEQKYSLENATQARQKKFQPSVQIKIFGQVWKDKYSKTGSYSCTNCKEIKANIYLLILSYMVLQLSLAFAIKNEISIRENKVINQLKEINQAGSVQTYEENQQAQKNKQNCRQDKISTQAAIIVKFMAHYFLILSSLSGFNLQIPKGVIETPMEITSPLRSSLSNLECFLSQMNFQLPFIYFRFLFVTLLPIVYFIVFLVQIKIWYFFQKKPFGEHILYSSGLFILFYTQPDILSFIIQLLSCRIINQKAYILANITQRCYTHQYYQYSLILVLPVFLIFVVGIPGFFFLKLYKNRYNITDPQIVMKFGYLLREYKKDRYYWDFIRMIERMGLIFVLNYYSQDFITKACLILIVVAIYWKLMENKKPYNNPVNQKIDNYLCMTCFMTVLFSLFLQNQPYLYFVITSLLIIAIINLAFIFYILNKFLANFWKRIQMILFHLLTSSCFKKFFKGKFQFIEKQQKLEQIRRLVKAKLISSIQELCKIKNKKQRMNQYIIFAAEFQLMNQNKKAIQKKVLLNFSIKSKDNIRPSIDNTNLQIRNNLKNEQISLESKIPTNFLIKYKNQTQENQNQFSQIKLSSGFYQNTYQSSPYNPLNKQYNDFNNEINLDNNNDFVEENSKKEKGYIFQVSNNSQDMQKKRQMSELNDNISNSSEYSVYDEQFQDIQQHKVTFEKNSDKLNYQIKQKYNFQDQLYKTIQSLKNQSLIVDTKNQFQLNKEKN
ncbi:hypothetical protein ABPG72_013500 [Tetrahymena utriculariae]